MTLLSRIEELERTLAAIHGYEYAARELVDRGFKATGHPLIVVVEEAPGLREALDAIQAKYPDLPDLPVAIIRTLGNEAEIGLEAIPTGDGPPLMNIEWQVERTTLGSDHRQETSDPGIRREEEY